VDSRATIEFNFLKINNLRLITASVAMAVAVLGAGPAGAQYCPLKVGAWDEGPASDLALVGELVYFTSGTMLRVVDISRPEAPRLVGEAPLPVTERQLLGRWIGLDVVQGHALVAAGSAGLLVYDVSDPSRPRYVSSYATPDHALDVVSTGSRAFLTVAHDGLHILDISHLPAIELVAEVQDPEIRAAVISDEGVLLLDGGLEQLMPSRSWVPTTLVPQTELDGLSTGLVVAGSRLFLLSQSDDAAWPDAALQVLSLTGNETSPRPLELSGCNRSARRAVYLSGHLFVTGWERGLCILDISDAETPGTVASYVLPVAESLAVHGRYLVVADQLEGLQIFDIGTCAEQAPTADFEVLGTGPVAGRPVHLAEATSGLATSFAWSLGDGGTASGPGLVHVYDTPGRYLIRLIASNPLGSDTKTRTIDVAPAPERAER